MNTRYVIFILAIATVPVLALSSVARCQATQPAASDRLIYLRVDGTFTELKPSDDRWPIVNRSVSAATLTRTDGSRGEWVASGAATQPATQPAVVVDPVNPGHIGPVPVPAPVADVVVNPSQSWVAGVLSAKPGQTVLITAGDYLESWKDTSKRPAAGVTIRGEGIGRTRLLATGGDHLLAWTWSNVSFAGLSFVGTDKPSGHGIRLNGCSNMSFVDCEASHFRMAVCIEAAGNKRSSNIRFVGGNYSDNWHPQDQHSQGFYADQTDGLQVIGATIARNGHNPAVGAKGSAQNHGGYVTGTCGPAVVTDCTIEDNSSHGWQARSGGVFERNACRRNPIHLSYGLVNGAGPIHLGGVSGTIAGNWFEGSRQIRGDTPRGYAIEIGNVAELRIADNEAYSTDPQPDLRIVPSFAWLRVDKCNLTPENPHKGKAVGVVKLTVEGNAVTWAGPKVFTAPGLAGEHSIQTDWPASDGVRGTTAAGASR